MCFTQEVNSHVTELRRCQCGTMNLARHLIGLRFEATTTIDGFVKPGMLESHLFLINNF